MIFVLASDGGSPLLLALQSVDWQLVLVELASADSVAATDFFAVDLTPTTTTTNFAHSVYCANAKTFYARLSHRNSVCPSVCHVRVDQSITLQAKITKSSPSAAWKTLVSETIKLFHNSISVTPNEGDK